MALITHDASMGSCAGLSVSGLAWTSAPVQPAVGRGRHASTPAATAVSKKRRDSIAPTVSPTSWFAVISLVGSPWTICAGTSGAATLRIWRLCLEARTSVEAGAMAVARGRRTVKTVTHSRARTSTRHRSGQADATASYAKENVPGFIGSGPNSTERSPRRRS